MRTTIIQKFLQLESASGIILILMAVCALILANSIFANQYEFFVLHVSFWVNELLMAVFFVLVGLELKRSYLEKNLTWSDTLLPAVAAFGGMVFPALIYVFINIDNSHGLKGWAIPTATDIAFALGVLSLFGKRVPLALKLFLLSIAIFDDIGAIIIIAFFFSTHLSIWFLLVFALTFLMLMGCHYIRIQHFSTYLFLGVLLWLTCFLAGIHPTIAGFLFALTIPGDANPKISMVHQLEDKLHPLVAYLIMPLFALVNAGFSFHGFSKDILTNTIVMGIVFGLFFGKQLGVFGFSWLLIKSGKFKLKQTLSWTSLYGVSILCGIGFTMSLFLGTLSFHHESTHLAEVRLGVLLGSVLSGLVGSLVLLMAFATTKRLKE